ncbi:hypothetical protein IC582_025511 [Cucumis melo]
MEIILFLSHLLPLLLLQLFSSSAYNPPDKYFLNCGSKTVTELRNNRRFIGDAKARHWSIYPGKSKKVKNDTILKSVNEIYGTARVYNKPTWYVFGDIDPNGTYVVRLHFFPTLPEIMSQAKFNVSVSCGFQLLSNFSIGNDLKTAVVKEFTFEIEERAFGIKFSPMESSMAFVNAIELFLVPGDIKPESAFPISPEVRMNGTKYFLDSQAFQSVYRVWMGHWEITPDYDTLWRIWLPGSKFMAPQSLATTFIYDKRLKYTGDGQIYVAPSSVFTTAKTLDLDTTTSSRNLNLTWCFKLKKKSKYFLRLLWCNIFPNSTTFNFNLFIGVNHTSLKNTDVTDQNSSGLPFWYEFIIATDSSGFFNVGIAVNKKDPLSRVFLNGIEIMELIDKSFVGVVDLRIEEEKQSPKMIIVGVCIGGVVIIIALIIGLAMFCFTGEQKSKEHSPLLLSQNDPSSKKIESIADLASNLNLELKIPFEILNDATDAFDNDKIIGIGGFGNVYVGKIGEKEVAVKRSQPGHGQGIKEFQTEIAIFSQIRHRFLVSLYGYVSPQLLSNIISVNFHKYNKTLKYLRLV